MKYLIVLLVMVSSICIGITSYFLIFQPNKEESNQPVNEDVGDADKGENNSKETNNASQEIWIDKEFTEYGFSLSYPNNFTLEEKVGGYNLISNDNKKLIINPEQMGIGFESGTTEQIPTEVNGITLNKIKASQMVYGQVSYLITMSYPASYQFQYFILFSYEETDIETMKLFDEIIASVKFIN